MRRSLILLAISSCLLAAEEKCCIDEALLAPAHSCTFCHIDQPGPLKLSGSFLIWQSKEWGLEFASKSSVASEPSSTSQTFRQKLFVHDFSWSPGFKIDFGYAIPYDGWDLDARWTSYHGDCTNLKKHLDMRIQPTGYGIVPLWHYPFVQFSSDSAPLRFQDSASNWDLYFNSIDSEIGRDFIPIRPLKLRLHFGAKASWIRQKYHVEYTNGTSVNALIRTPPLQTLQYLTSRTSIKTREWGIGPNGGLNSKWKIGNGFSLLADAAFSCLYSLFKVNSKFADSIQNLTADEPLSNNLRMHEHMWRLIPVLEGDIGIDWGMCFRQANPFYIGISIAYEFQYWFSQNVAKRPFAFQSPGNMWDMRGDLQMHGLTASIRSDF